MILLPRQRYNISYICEFLYQYMKVLIQNTNRKKLFTIKYIASNQLSTKRAISSVHQQFFQKISATYNFSLRRRFTNIR